MEKIISADKNEASLAGARKLNELLKVNKPVLLMFSGGSAFSVLNFIDYDNLDEAVTITVLDERFSSDPKINNFLQLSKTKFFKKAIKAGCKFINTDSLDKTLANAAAIFEKALRQWKNNNPQGKIIITQGIGSDGHTAGIMPYPQDKVSFDKLFLKNWVVGYDAQEKNEFPERITVTIKFLQEQVDESLVYAVGKDKSDILQTILKGNQPVHKVPGAVINSMKNISLFTDNDV